MESLLTEVESCWAMVKFGHRNSRNVKNTFTLFIFVLKSLVLKGLFIPVVFDCKGMKRFLERENYFTDICLTFTNKLKPSVLLQLLNTHLKDVLDEFIGGFILEFGEFADDNLLLLGLEHI